MNLRMHLRTNADHVCTFIAARLSGFGFFVHLHPIVTSIIFSFNSERFPTVPLGSFTWKWYQAIYADADVWEAAKTSIMVAISTSILATLIGFCTAYTDFRYQFRGKNSYLVLALLPPTIPLIILALAMLAWFSRLGISGKIWAIIIGPYSNVRSICDGGDSLATAANGPRPGICCLEPGRQRMECHAQCSDTVYARPAIISAMVPDHGGIIR